MFIGVTAVASITHMTSQQ